MVKDKDRARRESAARESSIASGWTIEGSELPSPADPAPAGPAAHVLDGDAPAGGADRAGTPGEPAPQQLSSTALVLLGLIGGLYLLYTLVWFSWANYYSGTNSMVAEGSGAIGGVLQQIVFWIAPFAPVLWFASVLVLCRGSRFLRKALWLLLGAVVLVPLPMFGGLI